MSYGDDFFDMDPLLAPDYEDEEDVLDEDPMYEFEDTDQPMETPMSPENNEVETLPGNGTLWIHLLNVWKCVLVAWLHGIA